MAVAQIIKQSKNIDPKSYTGIYSMHKYWSKKPFNIIRQYIDKYSSVGDIVLDPFCGSGIANVEALILDRKTVGIDINPMATFITLQMLQRIPINKAEQQFEILKQKCHKKINELYLVKRKNQKLSGTHFVYSNNQLIEVWCKDENNKKIILEPQKSDVDLVKSFSYDSITLPYPKISMIENSRINAKKDMKIFELFTPRNLLALSILMNQIKQLKDKQLENFFKFCFTASTGQSSKMVFVVNKRGKFSGQCATNRKEVGSWVIGYWVPKENFEINVWNCFENRYNRIIKAKKQQNMMDFQCNLCNAFDQLSKPENNSLIINDSCHHALAKIPNNSIDYVITDPPHGNRLPYMELSMMWNGWLNIESNMDDELVISDAKERGKNKDVYNQHINKILSEIERVLKPFRYFTLMFNSMDTKTWNNLQRSLFGLHFEITDINTVGYSAASVIQDTRKRGLKTDFAFTFRKSDADPITPVNASDRTVDLLVKRCMDKDTSLPVYEILNQVINNLMLKKRLFDMSKIITSIDVHRNKIERDY